MDELKLRLSTKWLRGIVSGFITKTLAKKLGYNVGVQINELEVKMEYGKVRVRCNVDAEMEVSDFMKLLQEEIG